MTAPALSPLSSLHALGALMDGPVSSGDLAVATGLPRPQTVQLVRLLQGAGLVLRASDRVATCTLHTLPVLPRPTDRITTQLILAQVDLHRTLPALEAATGLPRALIGDTLRRAWLRGEVRCLCVGHLPVFERAPRTVQPAM
ncbi:MarR family transcriptional regulator [Deinococcus aluminii]|uniref:HTH marR-type domain-containing protein n=1 Tax=Deinococcus aluminii TaxID=1656885 RepID=A0ABP9XF12_9DEIO